MPVDMNKFLSHAASSWEETIGKAREGGSFENHADGTYIMQLSAASLEISKKTERPMVKWVHTILDGDLVGKTYNDFTMLDGDRGLEPLVWRLEAWGIKPEDIDLEELEQFLEAMVEAKMVAKILLKTSKANNGNEYQNMSIQKLLPNYLSGGGESGDGLESTPPVAGAEAPPATDEDVQIQKGMKVKFKSLEDEELVGTIKEIDEPNDKVSIQVKLKKHIVPLGNLIELVEEPADAA